MHVIAIRFVKPAYFLILLASTMGASAKEIAAQGDVDSGAESASLANADLGEIDRRLNNPLTDLWSLTLQENYSLLTGDAAEDTYGNLLFFQPALPILVGEDRDKVFIARPVFPLVTAPVFDPSQPGMVEGHTTGFGDMQLFTMIGPSRSDGKVWGVGGTFIFPTASSDVLGENQWQAGPAAMFFNMGRPWTLGLLLQHWWSIAGDSNAPHTSRTDLQYIARRQIIGGWSLGMGPTITYDWTAASGDRLTVPIGLGVTRTFRFGKTPVKMRLEPQYSIVKPDNFGTEWNFRFQIAPVIQSPYSR